MTYYNLTQIAAQNSTLGIFQQIDAAIGGIYSLLFLIAIFCIFLINYTTKAGLPGSFVLTSFIVTVIGGFFWLSGVVQLYVFIVLIVLNFIALIIYYAYGE